MAKVAFSKIRKRSGELVEFRSQKIAAAVAKAAIEVGLDDVKIPEQLADEVTARLAKRFTKDDTPTVEQIQDVVEETLLASEHHAMAKAYILYRQRRAAERAAKAALVGKVVKTRLTINGLRLVRERYLQRDADNNLETPSELFMRVAKAAAVQESDWVDEREQRSLQIRFYNMLQRLDFLPNTPALINAGRSRGTLFSSTAIAVPDSIEGIFHALKEAAILHQAGSGVGFTFSRLRQAGAAADGVRGLAQGPIAHLKTFDAALAKIRQLGIRQGANMGILRVDHPDILDFVTAKAQDRTIANFNLSVGLTDAFLEAVLLDEEYDLIDPRTNAPVGTLNARQVLDIIVASAWNYGDPGVLFLDRIGRPGHRPFCATSPCAEFILEQHEAGIVGSINLANMVDDGRIDWPALESTTELAVRLLDDLIDASHHPIRDTERLVARNRKIGVGVMGWAHMLAQLNIAYDSDEAVELASKVMERIKETADHTSRELGALKGFCPDKTHRNLTRTAISPTGSISMIADCSSGIEPLFATSYARTVAGGREYHYLDRYLQAELKRRNLDSEELIERVAREGLGVEGVPDELRHIFTTSMQITPDWHIRMQVAFQQHTDNAVSKTVNLPHNATLLDVENAILLAYQLGCKGITVYRQGSRSGEIFKLTEIIKHKQPAKIPRVLDQLRSRLTNQDLSQYSR